MNGSRRKCCQWLLKTVHLFIFFAFLMEGNNAFSSVPEFISIVPPSSSCRQRRTNSFALSSVNSKAPPETSAEKTSRKKKKISSTIIDTKSLNKQLNQCNSKNAANLVLEQALALDDDDDDGLYGSVSIPIGASDKSISDGDLAIQTKVKNSRYSIMDLIELNGDKDADRASLALLCLMIGSSSSAIIANQSMSGGIPEILRFIVVWILSFMPLIFVGYGIATPDALQTFLVSIQRNVFPTYRQRMIQHEAGHFLMGHLLGLPIKSYQANAIKNAVEFYPLNDPDAGLNRATMLGFDVTNNNNNNEGDVERRDSSSSRPYFSPDGSGGNELATNSVFRKSNKKVKDYEAFLKLPSQNEPTKSWPFRGFSESEIDKLSVVSLAGVCAEILAFGNAEGGYADMSQLRQLFNRAEPELNERDMDNRIRFALGFGMSQLRLHMGALDALATVMSNDGSVAECILAIESCANVRGGNDVDSIMGKDNNNYELRRRNEFRSKGVGFVERLFLGDKSADTKEDRLVEGKGGGYEREKFSLSGDDPLYVAVAVATCFFIWASSGGLSLH